VIACQDWILWNTEHHKDLKPYWPEMNTNALVVCDVDERWQDGPLYQVHGPSVSERLAEINAA